MASPAPCRLAKPVFLLASLIVLACSPEPRVTEPADPVQQTPFNAGALRGTISGRVRPAVTTTGSGATITGLTAQFTSLQYQSGSGGSSVVPVYLQIPSNSVSFAHIWRIGLDGSGLTQVTFDSGGEEGPDANLRTGQLAYWRGRVDEIGRLPDADLDIMNSDGSVTHTNSQTHLPIDLAWVPDGSIIFHSSRGTTGVDPSADPGAIFQTDTNGNTPHSIFEGENSSVTAGLVGGHPTAFFESNFGNRIIRLDLETHDTMTWLKPDSGTALQKPELSPDGTRLLYWRWTIYGPMELRQTSAVTQGPSTQLAFEQNEFALANYAAWLPDGSGVLASLQPADTFIGVHNIWLIDTLGNRVRQVTSFTGNRINGLTVGPAPTQSGSSVVLLGEGGVLGEAADGILFGQGTGGTIASVVAFQGSRRIELITGTGLNSTAPVLTYTVTADQLQSLRFIGNPELDSAVTVIDSASAPATGALVTFDATTGAVALILPFANGRSVGSIITSDDHVGRTFAGNFLAVIRGDGKNLAPGGATGAKLLFAGKNISVIR